MNIWTNEEIAKVLIQLDERKLPFKKYTVLGDNGALRLLGRGGFADVYEASKRGGNKNSFAVKVIGFGDRHSDSAFFEEAVQAQKEIGDYQDNVVKIYGHTQLWVFFDENDNVMSAVKEEPEVLPPKVLKLQFIVMENISSVLRRTKSGNICTSPEQLSVGDEREVLKLASDIGNALLKAHNKNILHRDVKLENVFYSPKDDRYKLGDFGIAKRTEDGFASTVAFTKGYAAPEVRGITDGNRYDNTADIYSFGMMLFVLMNQMKFPDSNTYNVNSVMQYKRGYIVPRPGNASQDFYDIIVKMCMYDPDERYQSMEEAVADIERLIYNRGISYKKEHKTVSLIVAFFMLVLGVAAWKFTLASALEIRFSFWEYLFWGCCLGKLVMKVFRRDILTMNVVIMALGCVLMIKSGFSWIRLLVLFCMVFSTGTLAGYGAVGMLTVGILSVFQRQDGLWGYQHSEYSWIAVTLFLLSIVLFYQYELLLGNRKMLRYAYDRGLFWIAACGFCVEIFLTGLGIQRHGIEASYLCWAVFKPMRLLYDMGVDYCKVGASGFVFCIAWIAREKVLIWRAKMKYVK